MIEKLQTAWREAYVEFIANDASGDHSCLTELSSVIAKIRNMHLLINAKPKSLTKDVYQDIHVNQRLFTLVMNSAITFRLELGNEWDKAISYFAQMSRPYYKDSGVTGKDIVDSSADVQLITNLCSQDPWLFMLFFASTQERITLTILKELVPEAVSAQPKGPRK